MMLMGKVQLALLYCIQGNVLQSSGYWTTARDIGDELDVRTARSFSQSQI
jgi:hypothetical protein